MKIKWLGHSAFLITSQDGVKIITDPYKSGGPIGYKPIKEEVDIVTISHSHSDHAYTGDLKGNSQIIDKPGNYEIKGVKIWGFPTFHDDAQGSQRGSNTVFVITVDEIQICHLGDLGHLLSPEQSSPIEKIHILLIPIGGTFTLDSREATRLLAQFSPNVIIPMHYKTDACELPLESVEDFLRGKGNIKRPGTSEIEYTDVKALPGKIEIVVLEHAL